MKIDGLKKLIKEAVREAIQDELKDILLEAVRAPKTVVQETYSRPSQAIEAPPSPSINHTFKRNLRDMVSGEFGTISATSANAQTAYTPPPINTVGEGTSLPSGEVSLNQIMGLMK